MHTVDEQQPMETLHIYVVPEELPHSPTLVYILLTVTLSVLFTLCYFTSTQQPQVRNTLRLAVVPLPLQSYSATAPILATGIKVYPASYAQGELTIYNGSILTQQLPAGMVLAASNGTEIMTSDSVYIPAANPPSYGIAMVTAHAAITGRKGNIAAWAVNQVYGTSFYIRNLTAFAGGKDGYSVKVITSKDIQAATDEARNELTQLISLMRPQLLLASPCNEVKTRKANHITLVASCQYISYTLPTGLHVIAMKFVGSFLYVDGWYVPHIQAVIRK